MPHSLRAKIKSLRYKRILTDKDCDRLCKALDNESVLNKIKAEIIWYRDNRLSYEANSEAIELTNCYLDIIDKYGGSGMTNKEKLIEVFGDNPKRHYITKSWWDEEYVPPVNPQEPMREFTEEEAKAYSKALDKMYKPTGFNVFNEPSGDLISRQAVLDAIENEYKGKANELLAHEIVNIMAIIDSVPPDICCIYCIKKSKRDNAKVVSEWKQSNPNGRKIQCARDTGLSRPTVDKYWKGVIRNDSNETRL